MVQIGLDRNHILQGLLSPTHAFLAQPERCSGRLPSSQSIDSTDSSNGKVGLLWARVARAIETTQNDLKKGRAGRVVSRAGCEFRFAHYGNERSLNKRVNLTHFVRWTAAPLQMCGFATQNFTTHLQSHIRRLRGR